ncbi:MAG TPA: L-ribulose-5-phosphate 4-epimerase AraD [Solirubrobacteraceae bacterium]|nr:L-ribulose-5-phosphate 4-epimerase AraD [Solirubrobacteraceae bacterium]
MSSSELREEVLEANLAIVRAGLVALTFGNVSAVDRARGVIAIKPSGVPYAELRPESIVLVDLATGQTIDGDLRPSSDTPTHLVLYRHFEAVGAIVHTHSPFATAWAQARTPIPCVGTTHADHFEGPVPVTRLLTDAELAGDYETATGEVIVETHRELELDPLHVPAVLVCSHGPFAWGRSANEAVENAIALEEVAASTMRSFQIAGAVPDIDPGLLDKHFQRKHGNAAYYGQPA